MHYEVYIDVLFFTNFMMDSLLLMTVRGVLKYRVPIWRVFLGSAAGAALSCMLLLIPLPGIVKAVTGFFGISTVMLICGLGVHTLCEWGKAIGLLFVSAFMLGGILQILRPRFQAGIIFFAAALAAYAVLTACWKLILQIQKDRRRKCEVILYSGEESHCVEALIDTGNRLRDPLSKEPVHVIDKRTAKALGDECMNTMRYIPYRTVNGTGVMPIIRMEKMCVKGEQELLVERPILGICEEMVSEYEEYQMILNADIL